MWLFTACHFFELRRTLEELSCISLAVRIIRINQFILCDIVQKNGHIRGFWQRKDYLVRFWNKMVILQVSGRKMVILQVSGRINGYVARLWQNLTESCEITIRNRLGRRKEHNTVNKWNQFKILCEHQFFIQRFRDENLPTVGKHRTSIKINLKVILFIWSCYP